MKNKIISLLLLPIFCLRVSWTQLWKEKIQFIVMLLITKKKTKKCFSVQNFNKWQNKKMHNYVAYHVAAYASSLSLEVKILTVQTSQLCNRWKLNLAMTGYKRVKVTGVLPPWPAADRPIHMKAAEREPGWQPIDLKESLLFGIPPTVGRGRGGPSLQISEKCWDYKSCKMCTRQSLITQFLQHLAKFYQWKLKAVKSKLFKLIK